MSDITANVVVSMPSQLFTMARSFKAVANGKIYIGKIDTDPVNPENQIQVYVENEDGSHVPVSQPIIINAAGYPVYNGQIAKFVTVQGHSMAVYDAYGVQQFYFPNVLKYDPDQFEHRMSQPSGADLVGITPKGSVSDNLHVITPEMFGALGDGESDDFQAIQDAIDYAALHRMRVQGTGKIYAVSSTIKLKVGIKSLSHMNIIAMTERMTVLSNNDNNSDLQCDVHDNEINLNGVGLIGMLFYGIVNSGIYNNKITGLTLQDCYGIRIGILSNDFISKNNSIYNNICILGPDPDNGTGTRTMVGIALIGRYHGTHGGIEENGNLIWDQPLTVINTDVYGNYVYGGTHNIFCPGCIYTRIHDNHFEAGSHRNINTSIQSQRLLISNNKLINAGSSAIVTGNTRWVEITGNYIQSSQSSAVSSDDSAIQFGGDIDGLIIDGNTIIGDWKYGVHGAYAKRVTIQNNRIESSKANIAIESSWLSSPPSGAIYSSSRNEPYPPSTATFQINISGNLHMGTGCAIYMSQLENKELMQISVSNELINNAYSRSHCVYVFESDSKASGLSLSNINASGASYDKYFSTRGNAPFLSINNVTSLTTDIVPITSATPILFGSDMYSISSTTPITDFHYGMPGEEINVKGFVGGTIIHNAGVIRLKGGVNYVGGASAGNDIIRFKRIGNTWFEICRNF
ncbi:phage head-binding domain-containing protein [Shigella flexneri]|nr:phage head-binding domain-containing protein [Shigella flexneri]